MSERTVSYLCIGCPLGCRLEVDEADGDVVEVRGFACKRGHEYALSEHRAPVRMVTTTVAIEGARWPRLPVRTAAPIPRDRVRALVDALHRLRLSAPVRQGDVVLADALGTGVEVIATRSL